MKTNAQLEAYLSKLDRALSSLPVSDRAEILIEIKSHVLSAMERDPHQSIGALIAALGEPELVANKYLMERGNAPVKPPISPVVKWLVMGFLGTLALFLFFAGTLMWKFSPLLQVDEKNERVRILGGLIDVDGKAGQAKIGSSTLSGSFELDADWSDSESVRFEGTNPVDPTKRAIDVRFTNGKFEVKTSETEKFGWDCRSKAKGETRPRLEAGVLLFDFSGMKGVRCDLSVPREASLLLKGTNGNLEINEPEFHLDARLVNGNIEIAPADDEHYRVDLSVVNGSSDSFDSSDDPKAYRLTAQLTNGRITKEK
ncbi:MAG: hypothetical protein A2X94_05120 [Bdellovibrionales bacterium GWB1_55_8]|nr:MAG: hypothetical protein A2X94_05120 [Bdellovibrionales bacterium GWB1_55_8]